MVEYCKRAKTRNRWLAEVAAVIQSHRCCVSATIQAQKVMCIKTLGSLRNMPRGGIIAASVKEAGVGE